MANNKRKLLLYFQRKLCKSRKPAEEVKEEITFDELDTTTIVTWLSAQRDLNDYTDELIKHSNAGRKNSYWILNSDLCDVFSQLSRFKCVHKLKPGINCLTSAVLSVIGVRTKTARVYEIEQDSEDKKLNGVVF